MQFPASYIGLEVNIVNDDYNEYIVLNDGMVDISNDSEPQEIIENKRRYSKKLPPKKKLIITISSVAAAVVAVAGITGVCLYKSGVFDSSISTKANADDYVFGNNVYVSGVSISGKNMSQAKILLSLNKKSFVKPLEINVDVNGKATKLTQDDFTYTYNIDELLEEIKKDEQSGDKTHIDSETGHRNYEVTASVESSSVADTAKKVADNNYVKAENATVSKFHPYAETRFEFAEAKQGVKVNEEKLQQQLIEVLGSNAATQSIVAEVETVKPEISVSDLKKNIVKLASYETYSTNTANGTSNMKVALAACNGSVIEPDGIWSFNGCTGDSNLTSNGYKAAHVISGGKLVDGIGGGICQASSTIYNAALRANMDVEERYCHKWASSYVPTGLDATIDYPNLDLKLSNPTKYQMFMECKLVDSTLYVSIWGYKPNTYDTIKTENKLTGQSSSSYSVGAWRVYYKDGKEVDREKLFSSSYDMEYGVVFINADNDTHDKVENVDSLVDSSNYDDDEPSSQSSREDSSSQQSISSSKPEKPSSSSSPDSSDEESEDTPSKTEPATEESFDASSETSVDDDD